MLYDFEIRINMCKNKSCSDNLNIYKSQKRTKFKSNNFTSELNSKKEEFKKSFMVFYRERFYFIGEYIKFI